MSTPLKRSSRRESGMRFIVKFINDSKQTELGKISDNSIFSKTFRYDLYKSFDLSNHIQTIHKSLLATGLPLKDAANVFSLRIRPEFEIKTLPDFDITFPFYLEEGCIELQLEKLEALKLGKNKKFILEFLLSPDIRAKRFSNELANPEVSSSKFKDIVFNLSTQLLVTIF